MNLALSTTESPPPTGSLAERVIETSKEMVCWGQASLGLKAMAS